MILMWTKTTQTSQGLLTAVDVVVTAAGVVLNVVDVLVTAAGVVVTAAGVVVVADRCSVSYREKNGMPHDLNTIAKAQWDEAEKLRNQARRKNDDFVPTRELASEKKKEDRKTHDRNKKRSQRAEAKERRLANQPAANEPEVVVPEVAEPEVVEPVADVPVVVEPVADEPVVDEPAASSHQMLPPPVPPLELQRPPTTPSPQLAATPSPATRGRPLSRKMSTESVPPRPTSTPRAASATRADKLKLFHAKSQLAAERLKTLQLEKKLRQVTLRLKNGLQTNRCRNLPGVFVPPAPDLTPNQRVDKFISRAGIKPGHGLKQHVAAVYSVTGSCRQAIEPATKPKRALLVATNSTVVERNLEAAVGQELAVDSRTVAKYATLNQTSTDYIYVLHLKFQSESPEFPLDSSSFYSLRPFFVCEPTEANRLVCLCQYHENIDYKLQALRAYGAISCTTSEDATLALLEPSCDPVTAACFLRDCKDCTFLNPDNLLREGFDGDLNHQIVWKIWTKFTTPGGYTRVDKLDFDGPIMQCLRQLTMDIDQQFAAHAYTMRQQFSYIHQPPPPKSAARHPPHTDGFC